MKKFLNAAALVAASLLAACGGGERLADENRIDAIRSDAPALAALGAYKVGVKTLSFTNPAQLDIANAVEGQTTPTYNRTLTAEVWYPATLPAGTSAGGEYRAMTRDGKTVVSLYGKAVRDAGADARGGPYPLIIMSHGYPGNRFLLSHLGENLASKGYVVVSIDHTDSTYESQLAFGSTLVNRSLDHLFVLREMARLNTSDPGRTLQGLVNANNTALIGYSMGAYGAINTVGAGVSAAAVAFPLPMVALPMAHWQYVKRETPRMRRHWIAESKRWLLLPLGATTMVCGTPPGSLGFEPRFSTWQAAWTVHRVTRQVCATSIKEASTPRAIS